MRTVRLRILNSANSAAEDVNSVVRAGVCVTEVFPLESYNLLGKKVGIFLTPEPYS